MDRLPASTGWLWIKQGFALFMKQPAGLTMLVIAYSFLVQLLSLIPLAGQVAAVILTPVFGMSFMQAYVRVEQRQRVTLNVLFEGFRTPDLSKLITLGAMYMCVMAIVMGIAWLNMGDLLVSMQKQEVSAEEARGQVNLGALLFWALLVYVPSGMAFFFSPMLVYWQRMKLGKALFFSFFTIYRALRAFLVFQLGWAGIFIFVLQVLGMLLGPANLMLLMRALLWPLAFVIFQCSAYVSYKHFFGSPVEQPAVPEQSLD